MAEIAEINGIAIGNVSKVNGIAKSALTNIQGFTLPASGTPTTYLDEDFNSLTDGANYPTNWNGSTGLGVYSGLSGLVTSTHAWRANDYRTSSSTTGPNSHHGGSDSSGAFGNTSDAYMYTEASGIYNKDHLLRTPELDFSNSLNNSTLKLTFWFHMYATSTLTSHMGELMVGVSDSATSAANGSVGTGFEGKADDASSRTGMPITFWDDASDDGSSTTTAIVIEGVQQTSGHSTSTSAAYWRKATVDLNAVAGESSVYIWFYGRTGALYQSDICMDTVLVKGEE